LSRWVKCTASPMGGTTRWMAPEVLAGSNRNPSPAADMFSVGRLAFFVSTGLKPLDGFSRTELVEYALRDEVPQLDWPDPQATNSLHCSLRELSDLCLELDAQKRPTSLDALLFLGSSAMTGRGLREVERCSRLEKNLVHWQREISL